MPAMQELDSASQRASQPSPLLLPNHAPFATPLLNARN
jgi:hypothetical protein